MSKNYKKKNVKDEESILVNDSEGLSKKELYDLNKKKKEEAKNKSLKKKEKKKKKSKSSDGTYQTGLLGRIFAVVMLILMIGSVVASIASYIR